MATVKAIIFDLDGTLIDSAAGIEEAIQFAVSKVMPDVKLPSVRHLIGPRTKEIFVRALGELKSQVLEALVKQFRVHYDQISWKQVSTYSGVKNSLIKLVNHQVKCFVVTNKPSLPTRKIVDHLLLDKFFVEIVSPDNQSPPFTSKVDSILYIMKKYDLDSRQLLVVGDGVDDAQAARICGVKFAAVSYGYGNAHLQVEEPKDYILTEFVDVLSIIE